MGESEHRQIARDSLFLMAELRLDGMEGEQRVRVRNLSAGGMMAEGGPRAVRGQALKINIRNIGWIDGSVAWVQDNRFGIAFRDEIDPKVARAPIASTQAEGDHTPRHLRPPLTVFDQAGNLRKV